MPEEDTMASSDRDRDVGALHLASTFLASFPSSASPSQERQLASLERVREDGVLSVRVDQDGKERVVRVSGELDIASARKLEDELRQELDGDASVVVLDLGGLSFIDSVGLRALLLAARLSAENGIPLRMVQATAPVREVIELSALDRLLPLSD
jgi:anti-anti-sigma factor